MKLPPGMTPELSGASTGRAPTESPMAAGPTVAAHADTPFSAWIREEEYGSGSKCWCCPMEEAFTAGQRLGYEEGLREAARFLEIGRLFAPALEQWKSQASGPAERSGTNDTAAWAEPPWVEHVAASMPSVPLSDWSALPTKDTSDSLPRPISPANVQPIDFRSISRSTRVPDGRRRPLNGAPAPWSRGTARPASALEKPGA